MTIELPDDHERRYESSVDMAKKLIKFGYFGRRIDTAKLDSWLANFETDDERYIASGILLSLMYRNDKALDTFAANIIQIMLPNFLEKHNILTINSVSDWEKSLHKGRYHVPQIRFSTIDGVDDRPAKSGTGVLRDIQLNFFHKNLGIRCENIDKELKQHTDFKVLVLFDDILATGEQFDSFVQKFKLTEKDLLIVYFPLAGYEPTVEELNSRYDNIHIIPVETLTQEASLFSDANLAFIDIDDKDKLKNFYLEICRKNSIKGNRKLGVGNLALSYVFEDSVPNNNIALLWYDDDNWTRLVGR